MTHEDPEVALVTRERVTMRVDRARMRARLGVARALVVALVLASAAGGCAGAGQEQIRVQTEGSKALEPSPLGLKNEDFWNNPHELVAPMRRKLAMERKAILAFDAPTEVLIEGRETLPAQVVRIAASARMQERPFPGTALVVGVDIAENVVRAAGAVRPTERETGPEPKSTVPPSPTGMGAESFTIDLRERLNLPWEPSLIHSRLIIWDEVSPARPVTLKAGKFEDQEVVKFRTEQREKTNVAVVTPAPGEPFATYKRGKHTPAVPEERGIAIAVPRVFPLDEGEPCVMHAAFRLAILKRHIVPSTSVAKAGTEEVFAQYAERVKAGEAMPTGVVPITLVATGTESTGPYVWRLIVPTHDKIAWGEKGAEVTGCFSIDLRTLEGFDRRPQTWFIYAFSSEVMAGPTTIGLTTRPTTP
jgi:hypothetical protein